MNALDEINRTGTVEKVLEESIVVPVIEEQVDIYKELRTTGVVEVRKVVHQREAPVAEVLDAETVEVERVPMGLLVETLPPVRIEGDTTVIPVVEEVLVVTKQLRLVEEVRITKRRSSMVYQEAVTLRSEEVIVERMAVSNQNPRA